MNKLHLNDEQLGDLLKSAAVEEPSSNFTSRLMLKVYETALEARVRKGNIESRIAKIMAAVVAASFVIILLLVVRSLSGGIFEKDENKVLIEKITTHPVTQLLSSPTVLAGMVALSIAVWILIYLERKFDQKAY